MEEITKDSMMKVIESMPLSFIQHFFKISCYYRGYIEMDNIFEQQALRSKYVAGCASSQNMLNIMLTLSSNGKSIEGQIKQTPEKTMASLEEAKKFFDEHHKDEQPLKSDTIEEAEELTKATKTKATTRKTTKKTTTTKRAPKKTKSE